MYYDESPAFAELCQRLYGKNLMQMSMGTMDEIELLTEHMSITADDRVLDLGVCFGRITEYMRDKTGADFTGIDINEKDISIAKRIERDGLRFSVADMNALPFDNESFNKVISIDSLYFVSDLERTLDDIMKILTVNGCLGICWSQPPRITMETVSPEYTEIGKWAKARGLQYKCIDRTNEHKAFWQKSISILTELKPAYEADGLGEEWQNHMDEHRQVVPLVMADKFPRWLYFIQK